MASFNKVVLAGNLTRDPELRFTPKGTAIAKFTLAINRKWRNAEGEAKEEVLFVDVDAFGTQAETISKYVGKGKPLLVEGRLRRDEWTGSDGQKKNKIGVVLESFSFLDSRGTTDANEVKPNPSQPQKTDEPPPPDEDGTTVPF